MFFSIISVVSYSFHMDILCVLYQTDNIHYLFKIEKNSTKKLSNLLQTELSTRKYHIWVVANQAFDISMQKIKMYNTIHPQTVLQKILQLWSREYHRVLAENSSNWDSLTELISSLRNNQLHRRFYCKSVLQRISLFRQECQAQFCNSKSLFY